MLESQDGFAPIVSLIRGPLGTRINQPFIKGKIGEEPCYLENAWILLEISSLVAYILLDEEWMDKIRKRIGFEWIGFMTKEVDVFHRLIGAV